MDFPKKIERILINYLKINQWDLKSIVIPINIPFKKICINNFNNINEKILYWEKPNMEFSFIAISSLISASSQKYDPSNILHNWDEFSSFPIPLVLKTKKFPVKKANKIWNQFSEADYIPYLIILQSESKSYLVANFFNNNDYEKILLSLLAGITQKSATVKADSQICRLPSLKPTVPLALAAVELPIPLTRWRILRGCCCCPLARCFSVFCFRVEGCAADLRPQTKRTDATRCTAPEGIDGKGKSQS